MRVEVAVVDAELLPDAVDEGDTEPEAVGEAELVDELLEREEEEPEALADDAADELALDDALPLPVLDEVCDLEGGAV